MAILKQLDDTPLAFGKHKGKTPNEIADDNPSYVVWAYENIERKICTQHLYEYCLKRKDSHFRYTPSFDDQTDYGIFDIENWL